MARELLTCQAQGRPSASLAGSKCRLHCVSRATYVSVRHQGHLAAEVGVVTGCCCSILQGLIVCLLDAQQQRPAPTATSGLTARRHPLSDVDEQPVMQAGRLLSHPNRPVSLCMGAGIKPEQVWERRCAAGAAHSTRAMYVVHTPVGGQGGKQQLKHPVVRIKLPASLVLAVAGDRVLLLAECPLHSSIIQTGIQALQQLRLARLTVPLLLLLLNMLLYGCWV